MLGGRGFMSKLFACVIGVVALLPLVLWYRHSGALTPYLSGHYPAGQLPYVLSKLFGLYALVFIHIQIIWVLLNHLRGLMGRRAHSVLGFAIACLALSHYVLFILATSLRQGQFASGLLWLSFRDFYHTYLSIGLLCLIALAVVVVAGLKRAEKQTNIGKWCHRLYGGMIVGVYLHSMSVGSEMRSEYAGYYFACLGAIILGLMVLVVFRLRRASHVTV